MSAVLRDFPIEIGLVPSYPVAEGRCSHCGHQLMAWTAENIVLALQRWMEKHGEPPTATQWYDATPENPSGTTVVYMFGSWNKGLQAAGLPIRRLVTPTKWGKDKIADAMLDWMVRHGRWPVQADWEKAIQPDEPPRPTKCTVNRTFGSWSAAKKYAGWNGK